MEIQAGITPSLDELKANVNNKDILLGDLTLKIYTNDS